MIGVTVYYIFVCVFVCVCVCVCVGGLERFNCPYVLIDDNASENLHSSSSSNLQLQLYVLRMFSHNFICCYSQE